jgi:hypothetical protein
LIADYIAQFLSALSGLLIPLAQAGAQCANASATTSRCERSSFVRRLDK